MVHQDGTPGSRLPIRHINKGVDMSTILVPLDSSSLSFQILPYVRTLALTLSARVCLLHVWEFDEDLLVTRQKEIKHRLREEARYLREAGLDVGIDIERGAPALRIVEIAEQKQVSMIAMATHGYSGFRRWSLGSVTDKVVQATTIPVFVLRSSEQPAPPEQFTLKHILVPLDGSELSKQALPLAMQLAAESHGAMHLLHVVEPEEGVDPNEEGANIHLGPRRDQALAEMCRLSEEELTHLNDDFKPGAIKISWHVCVGYPAEKIIEEAEWQRSDLIVMATHGYSGFQRWALGSISNKVLQATSTPLVLIHAREA